MLVLRPTTASSPVWLGIVRGIFENCGSRKGKAGPRMHRVDQRRRVGSFHAGDSSLISFRLKRARQFLDTSDEMPAPQRRHAALHYARDCFRDRTDGEDGGTG